MARTKTRLWDAAKHLETEEDMAAYLEAALEDRSCSGGYCSGQGNEPNRPRNGARTREPL